MNSDSESAGVVLFLAALAACGLMLFLPVAEASSSVLRDRSFDTKYCGKKEPRLSIADIVRVRSSYTKGRIKHVIQLRKARDGYFSGDARAGIQISVDGGKKYRYTVYAETGLEGPPAIYDGEKVKYNRNVRFKRRGKSLIFSFKAKAIGQPRRYRWRAWTGYGDCDGTSGDYAPNRGKPGKPHGLPRGSKPGGNSKPESLPASKRKVFFTVDCKKKQRCAGRLAIKKGKLTLARGRYSAPPGGSDRLQMKLTSAGRAKVAAHRRVRVRLVFTPYRTGKSTSLPAILKRG